MSLKDSFDSRTVAREVPERTLSDFIISKYVPDMPKTRAEDFPRVIVPFSADGNRPKDEMRDAFFNDSLGKLIELWDRDPRILGHVQAIELQSALINIHTLFISNSQEGTIAMEETYVEAAEAIKSIAEKYGIRIESISREKQS